ncbi:hypothetical protein F5879DRAFT_1070490 [Lentinula edodes]|nr:hypothetical protein F5879DRAFT_1070490 [Lentinula edodes]
MFNDTVSRASEFKDVATHLQGRKFRVVTMFSGTDFPLLTLEMIVESTIPGNVDFLVAGTSCVNYSNLNNEKQDIDTNGELGRTFHEEFPILKKRKEWVEKLRRPGSSTLDSFLLPMDDLRIHYSGQKQAQESENPPHRRTGRRYWNHHESRHRRVRLEQALGLKWPWTSWDEGQIERVWDLLDIGLLRDVKKGIDPSYKTLESLTKCCGGPIVGLEALSTQGIPVDRMLLIRKVENQLVDLARNVMSTTVVGVYIIGSMVIGLRHFKKGDEEAV